jgi:hypothetical protein
MANLTPLNVQNDSTIVEWWRRGYRRQHALVLRLCKPGCPKSRQPAHCARLICHIRDQHSIPWCILKWYRYILRWSTDTTHGACEMYAIALNAPGSKSSGWQRLAIGAVLATLALGATGNACWEGSKEIYSLVVTPPPAFIWPMAGEKWQWLEEPDGFGLKAVRNAAVLSTAAGVVTVVVPSTYTPPSGPPRYDVTIQHSNGIISLYGGVADIVVSIQEHVVQGQPIGFLPVHEAVRFELTDPYAKWFDYDRRLPQFDGLEGGWD